MKWECQDLVQNQRLAQERTVPEGELASTKPLMQGEAAKSRAAISYSGPCGIGLIPEMQS